MHRIAALGKDDTKQTVVDDAIAENNVARFFVRLRCHYTSKSLYLSEMHSCVLLSAVSHDLSIFSQLIHASPPASPLTPSLTPCGTPIAMCSLDLNGRSPPHA